MNYILRSGAMIALTISGLLFATAANAQTATGVEDMYNAPMGANISVAAPGVLQNDIEAGGYSSKEELTAAMDQAPQFGSVALSADGGFVYTTVVKTGIDWFTYICSDDQGNTATATVWIVFEEIFANEDMFKVDPGNTNFVCAPGVLENDIGPQSGMTAALITAPQFGELDLHADGSFIYIPSAASVDLESDEFTYAAVDETGNSVNATVRLFFRHDGSRSMGSGDNILSITGGTPAADVSGVAGNEGGSCSASEGVSPWLLLACLALLVSALRMRRAGA